MDGSHSRRCEEGIGCPGANAQETGLRHPIRCAHLWHRRSTRAGQYERAEEERSVLGCQSESVRSPSTQPNESSRQTTEQSHDLLKARQSISGFYFKCSEASKQIVIVYFYFTHPLLTFEHKIECVVSCVCARACFSSNKSILAFSVCMCMIVKDSCLLPPNTVSFERLH